MQEETIWIDSINIFNHLKYIIYLETYAVNPLSLSSTPWCQAAKDTNGCTFILLFEKKICCKALTVMYFKTNYKWFSDCLLFRMLSLPRIASISRGDQERLEVSLAHVSEVWGQVPVWVVLLTGYCSPQQAGGPKAKAKLRSIREHTVTSLPLEASY